MAASSISVPALALAAGGAVTVYAAVKGVGLASGFRNLLAGQPLPSQGEDLSLTTEPGTDPGTGGGGVASNNAIAAAGTAYVGQGHVYRWGGGNPGGWDCSGFVNYVLCHDLGLDIPGYKGGAFNGSGHGPVTGQWALWSGVTSIPRAQVDAGDLVIWPAFHMGIAVSNTQMVACPGPNGTPAPVIGRIDGSAGGPLVCRRVGHITGNLNKAI